MSETKKELIQVGANGEKPHSEHSQKNSTNYEGQLSYKNKSWQTPIGIAELLKQVKEINTMILNDTITLEIASKYHLGARTSAQLFSLLIHEARMKSHKPETNV